MKRTFFQILNTTLVVLLTFGAFVTAFVSCNNDTPGGERPPYSGINGDATYILTISPPADRAVPLEGDDYLLLINRSGGVKTSAGYVNEVKNNVLVLQPSTENAPEFTVTISGAAITRIDGSITFVTGPSELGPGSLDSVNQGENNQGENNQGENDQDKNGGNNSPKTCTVTFSINGGVGLAPSARTVNAGANTTLPDDFGFARSLYFFRGWNTKADGTGNNYSAGSSYTPSGDTANITLYAVWEKGGAFLTVICTLTFDANGGSGTPPAAVGAPSSGYATVLPGGGGLSKPGCTFGGWNTKADGTGTNYPVGAGIYFGPNDTLYAKWNGNPTNVTYPINITVNPSGKGTVTARVGNSQVTSAAAGATVTLTATPVSGYTFMGWSNDYSNLTVIDTRNPVTFNMPDRAVNIIAYFEPEPGPPHPINISINPPSGGTVVAMVGNDVVTSAPAGVMITFTATPAQWYAFVVWNHDATDYSWTNPNNPTIFVEMPDKALNITAVFSHLLE